MMERGSRMEYHNADRGIAGSRMNLFVPGETPVEE